MPEDNPQPVSEVAPVAPLGTELGEGDVGNISARNVWDRLSIATATHFLDIYSETITYNPVGGISRSIKAIVERGQPAALGPLPQGTAPVLAITVRNCMTSTDDDDYGGINSSELDLGGDTVTVEERLGKTADKNWPLSKLLNQDAGMIKIGINR